MRAIKNISYIIPQAGKGHHQPLPAETLKLLQKVFSAKHQGVLSSATNWWAHLDLNQGPKDYESSALTN